MHSSLAILPALAATVFAQGTALPDSVSASGVVVQTACYPCFIVANVGQVIWADYTQTATESAVVSQGTGRNGTVITTTLVQPAQAFSFDTTGLLSGTPVTGAYIPVSGTLLTISGATYTSPMAFNVFTAFTSFTQTANGDGSCVASPVTVSSLSTAIRIPITQGAADFGVSAAELEFINSIGGAACAAGGVSLTSTVIVPTTTSTTTVSTSGLARPSQLPDTTAASTSSAASTSASTSASSSASSSAASTSATSSTAGATTSIVLLTPTFTIIQGAGSTFHPRAFSASLVTALLIIPGIVAWLL
ncbi:MAG: hypothetical protein GOMPHAMPRED_003219 [Gomphillus americanus]|uniref:Uncharacterized protein n=1 Tax=Gomphillus americanus TaxID=1940652 RepID=A0A8H3EHP8_9LECA|nr:MAG: hypothetical protein GOMPHAMPRED_003219 [Gomphillus americanus]